MLTKTHSIPLRLCEWKSVTMLRHWNNFSALKGINIEIATIHCNSIGVIKSKFAFK